ncbi:MAG: HipA N-terminal domain-containing protein [Bacteroidetes bacterium]|nr:HipA N-terminal domain-containing protein [Bacteroidota bacterium]
MAEERFDNTTVVKVSIHGKPIGRMAMASDRRCMFEYDETWLDGGFSISPFYLSLKPGLFTAKYDPFNGLFGVFDDSLPDGWGSQAKSLDTIGRKNLAC